MSIDENSFPEELVCNCGSSLRRNHSGVWICAKCKRSCTITGRISIRDPESSAHLSLEDFAALGWPGPYENTSEDLWAELDSIETRLKFFNSDASEFLPDGPFDLPGDDERGD